MINISSEKVRQILKDAGLTKEETGAILPRLSDISPDDLLKLLEPFRKNLLDDMHGSQKKLECLDYLRYQIINNNQEEK